MDRLGKLRVVYAVALANEAVAVIWMLAPEVSPGVALPQFFYAAEAVAVLLFAAPLILLLLRPLAWGRLLLPFYGFGWIMLGAVPMLRGAPLHVIGGVPLFFAGMSVRIACGVVFIALAIAHQLNLPPEIEASA